MESGTRGSLNKLRPGALGCTGKGMRFLKLVHEYQVISHLQVDLTYDWDEVDLDVMVEDVRLSREFRNP